MFRPDRGNCPIRPFFKPIGQNRPKSCRLTDDNGCNDYSDSTRDGPLGDPTALVGFGEGPMSIRFSGTRRLRGLCAGLATVAALAATGCQHTYNGQTLPSGYYHSDDVQYFRPGPEFKLANEAAAMQTYAEQQSGRGAP
jgi:hypothetical protein